MVLGMSDVVENPMRSDVPRCGLMWSDAVIRPTANFYHLQFSNVMCSGFSTAIALCFRFVSLLSLIHISEPRDRQKSRMPSSA